MGSRSRFCLRLLFLVTLGGCGPVAAVATEIKERLPSGLEVNAEFTQGQAAKPAVLILHGFLQTYNNATVSNLASALANDGYTVLAPTLSLGISNRRQTLSCETPHPHVFAADVAEVDFWERWLTRRGAASIVLIGHSTGNVQLLAYASEYRPKHVKQIITISLIEYAREFGGKQNLAQNRQAQKKVKSGDARLGEYKLSYCNKYVAPAQAFLSYAEWDENKLLATLRSVAAPIVVIAGDADERMRDGWLDSLRALPVKITTIKGANHFFSDVHEFDLHDRVIQSLSK
jgi:pimeloyl-ACP methyl ester carboxylesterase